MRMWMVDPAIMCRQHLLGEHNELHMLTGCLRLGRSVHGYARRGLIDNTQIDSRHFDIVAEMQRRGYQHRTPIDPGLFMLGTEETGGVDPVQSLGDLLARCPRCRERYRCAKQPA